MRIKYANICAIPGGASFTIGFTGNVTLDTQTTSILGELGYKRRAKVFQPNPTMVVIELDYDYDLAADMYEAIKPILRIGGIDVSNAPALQSV